MAGPVREPIPDGLNRVSRHVVEAAYAVHRALGPGLLESVYERCMVAELAHHGVASRTQVDLPISYRDVSLDSGYRLDLVVADELIVEIKAVERLLPIHEAQLLTYLKLSGKRLGLLINFNVPLIKDGIRRLVL